MPSVGSLGRREQMTRDEPPTYPEAQERTMRRATSTEYGEAASGTELGDAAGYDGALLSSLR